MTLPLHTAAPLDYYLLLRPADDRVEGVVIEEFSVRDDGTVSGLDTSAWTVDTGGWWSSAEFGAAMRADPAVRGRLRPVHRDAAETAYRLLSGGALDEEAVLRLNFLDHRRLPNAAPLSLNDGPEPGSRVYRILFAGDFSAAALDELRAAWQLVPVDPALDPLGRVVGRTQGTAGAHDVAWELRRIGAGLGWAVDVTVRLREGDHETVPAALYELRQEARACGLLPVTVERFA
ncbi:hypothetical protein CS0771_66740 [Catellatospora sp. IY07-71]|uniref:hypothetical protein n=1 Tax=Catellatospora sp. IY07-71 TaxID=2728827 RepID=UPI001BB3C81D|nr:hypothetical protein [Catellatospora sp. IY07-71]BCJ77130.1 hypothetical protein CS0771_66740 [Catellatospora sp. IY07-71]